VSAKRPLSPADRSYLLGLIAILWLFYRRLGRAHTPPEVREARAHGLPATATILSIEPTGWRSGSRTGGYRFVFTLRPFSIHPRTPKREYQMRLRVMRPGAADYEAELAEYLRLNRFPSRATRFGQKSTAAPGMCRVGSPRQHSA
jgi:hypothetical protein